MVFSSTLFLAFFLPVFLLVYFLLPYRFKNYWILAASIAFYAWGAPKFIFVVLAVLLIDYWLGNRIYENTGHRKKAFLAASIALNLGLLFYFKYFNFFFDNVNALFTALHLGAVSYSKVLLPIGVSFFVFQEMSYTIDIYRGEHAPLRRFSDYMLFIFLFSHLIAGPIVTYHVLANDIVDRRKKIHTDYQLAGFFRFFIGLARKVLLANPLGAVADHFFHTDPHTLTAADAWLGALAYTFQLYFDFAGYSDMAIGLGKIMGFDFPENFNSPYISQNITEFWRRWHITLGSWMRNYLYIPLGGNRGTAARTYVNLWVVFFASGIWHGASWTFVLWGAYHGLFIVIDRLGWLRISEKLPRVMNVLLTFVMVTFGWVLFRAETLPQAWQYMVAMCTGAWQFTHPPIAADIFIFGLACCFAFAALLPALGKRLLHLYEVQVSTPILLARSGLAMVLFLLSMAAIVSSSFNPFIYFRF